MNSTTLFPGRYVQGADALKRLGKEVLRLGNHGFVICDPFVYDNLLPSFKSEMESVIKILICAGLHPWLLMYTASYRAAVSLCTLGINVSHISQESYV